MVEKDFLIWMLILAVVIILTIPYAWDLLKVIFAGGSILHYRSGILPEYEWSWYSKANVH